MIRLRLLLPLVVLAAACSTKNNTNPIDSGTQTDGGLVTPKNAYYCDDPVPAGCAAVAVCGVCVPTPPAAELVRTTDTKEFKGTGPVDVGCFNQSTPPPALTSAKTATMSGVVKIFANGPDSKNVRIDVYQEAGGDVGTLVATGYSDETLGTETETIMKSGMPITRTLYKYKIDSVPTETPLVIKTTGKTDADGWFPLYEWNVIARESTIGADRVWTFTPRALGNDDYGSILQAAYSRRPEPGQAAIAGEVHDCGDVRLSNATVEINPKSSLGLFYLSEEEDDPLPDASRKSTGKLGLYAVGGLKPGPYTVAAAGRLNADVVSLGYYRITTQPDSVSVVTFRGLRPWQLK